MRGSKFFRYLWRVNAVIIFGAGLLAIVMLGMAAFQFWSYRSYDSIRPSEQRAKNSAAKKEDKIFSLKPAERIHGQPFFMAALQASPGRESYYSRKDYRHEGWPCNYLFLAKDVSSSAWLFPDNNFLIEEAKQLPKAGCGSEDGPAAQAVLFSVIKDDSNGDGRLTSDDLRTAVLVKPDGSHYLEIAKNVKQILSNEITDGGSLLLVWEGKEGVFAASVSLTDFSVSKQKALLPSR